MSDTSGDEAHHPTVMASVASAVLESAPLETAPVEGVPVVSASAPASTGALYRHTGQALSRANSRQPAGMNGPLYKQSQDTAILVRRHRRKDAGPWKQLACWLVENQIGMPIP